MRAEHSPGHAERKQLLTFVLLIALLLAGFWLAVRDLSKRDSCTDESGHWNQTTKQCEPPPRTRASGSPERQRQRL